MGISSSGATVGGPASSQSSAAPASGKYGGFSNKDFEQMGYNNPSYGGSSTYDPYVNKSGSTTAKAEDKVVKEEKPKKKKKKEESSDSSASSSSDSSSEEEKVEKKKKKTGLCAPK